MHIKSYLFLVVLLWVIESSLAQQANNWYFTSRKSLTFNTNPPSALYNSQSFFGGSASISDNQGQLLFYSDARRVFNRNHQIMPNGDNIFGASIINVGAANQALILPYPGNSNLYYLFTNETNEGSPTGYYYHLIDMNANGGLGDVVLKNQLLYGNSGMRMTAAPLPDGSGYWFISMEYRRKVFRNYRITCQGINLTPVIDTISTEIYNGSFDGGDIKASTTGNYLCAGYRYSLSNANSELYHFNRSTGKITGRIVIPKWSIGREFSPNDRYLYLPSYFDYPNNLFQLDLSVFDSATISNTSIVIGQGGTSGLQLGPDGRIYVLDRSDTLFSYIPNPDLPYPACGFVSRVIPIEGNGPYGANGSFYGLLPFFLPSLLANQNVQIPTYTIAADCRTVTLTGRTYIRGSNLTFKWRFGDGDSLVQVVPSTGSDTTYTTVTHTFPAGIDTFNVQLFVTSDTVCGQGSAGKRVVFGLVNRPTARFGYTATCGSLSVPFSDSSLANGTAALSYNWRFLDKNNVLLGTSALQNPTFTFPLFDTVKAMLIVSGNNACTRPDTLLKTIVLQAKPVAAFSYANTCGSLSATFTNSSTIAAGTVQSSTWLLGDGTTSTLQSPAHTYSSFGNYTVKLVVTSTAGCTSDTAVQTILIKAKPAARIAYDTNTCAASPILLRDSSTVAAGTIQSYYWQAQGQSFAQANIQPLFPTGGNYTVQHSVTSQQGCTSDTITQNIFIESIPVAAITAPPGGCSGDAVTFTSNSTIAFGQISSSRWQVGNNTPVNQNSTAPFIYSFPAAGSYNIQHQAISRHGCLSNTATQTINIESKPVADFTKSLLCPGKAVQFTNSSTAATGTISSSQWSINNAAPTTVTGAGDYSYTFSRGGTYTVQLTVTTAGGCSSTITKTILVEPAIASAGNDTTVREGEPFVLQGSGGINYLWQPPTGLNDATAEKPTGLLNSSQRYSVQITTAQGCIGFDTVLVTVLRQLKIANAFSPNGDGINDEWRIDQLKDYPNAQLQLFDRYGQTVYTAKGNSITGWKGTAGGSSKPAPVGTYYYIITLNNELNKRPYTGWVMVVR